MNSHFVQTKEKVKLEFEEGTLLVSGLSKNFTEFSPEQASFFSGICKWDARVSKFRALAHYYSQIALLLYRSKIDYEDCAKQFLPCNTNLAKQISPRDHQAKALNAWISQGRRGVVVLPTGAGKTILACLAIEACKRPTLIHVPTIDLLNQWKSVLEDFFQQQIGTWGGGTFDTQNLTVTTYDSALIFEKKAQQSFGLLVFDECHHLPGELTKRSATLNIAPYRLGLTATLEREDSKHLDLEEYVGPTCFEIGIKNLVGGTLANYETHTISVQLNTEEREDYEKHRTLYKNFLYQNGIQMNSGSGWQEFIQISARSAKGREAFQSYLKHKAISISANAKLEKIAELIVSFHSERIIVFTQDNNTAYHLGRLFLFPVLTHHTKAKERAQMLKFFKQGIYSVLITSKVLNEGVDVPEASIAIVVSGSGTVREHVQRLGRILRSQPGKKAKLFELVTEGTNETYTSEKRKQHSAYQTNS